MEIELEKKILDLARQLGNLNRQIIQSIAATGSYNDELIDVFYSLREALEELMGNVPPLSIRDPAVVKILRGVREGNFFYIDKQCEELIKQIGTFTDEEIEEICEDLQLANIEVFEAPPNMDLELFEKIFDELNIGHAAYF